MRSSLSCITCITCTTKISHQQSSWDILDYHWISKKTKKKSQLLTDFMTTWNKEMLALLRNISMFCWKRDLVGCSRKPWHFRSCRRNILILFYGIPNLHLTTARSCIDFVIAKYKKVEGSETSFWAHFSTPIVIFDTHDSLPDNKFDIAIGIDIWWRSN